MDRVRMISSSDVRRVLAFKDLLPAVERSLAAFSRGPLDPTGAIQPLRSIISVADRNGRLLVMPGYVPKEDALATKIITIFPDNAKKGLSSHNAIVVLMSPDTGHIQAFVDGDSLTELRTASASGVASKYLTTEEVKKVAVLGAGIQGAAHARVHHHLYSPEQISIWSRTESNAKKLVEILMKEGIKAVFARTAEEATKGADIINTCTFSPSPILWSPYVKRGAHVNAVGAPKPEWKEIDPELMTSSVVYTDSKEAAMAESGDVIQSKAEIYAEIGDVINGSKMARRNETTIFKSLGIGVLDAVSAHLVYDILQKEDERENVKDK